MILPPRIQTNLGMIGYDGGTKRAVTMVIPTQDEDQFPGEEDTCCGRTGSITVTLADLVLCIGGDKPVSFTGVNGTFNVPYAGRFSDGTCGWSTGNPQGDDGPSDSAIGALTFESGAVRGVGLGVVCELNGTLTIVAATNATSGDGSPSVFFGSDADPSCDNIVDCSETSGERWMHGGSGTIG